MPFTRVVLLVMESSPRWPLIPSISLRISPSPSSWSFPVILLHEPPNHAMDGWLEAGSTIFTKQKMHLFVVNVVTYGCVHRQKEYKNRRECFSKGLNKAAEGPSSVAKRNLVTWL